MTSPLMEFISQQCGVTQFPLQMGLSLWTWGEGLLPRHLHDNVAFGAALLLLAPNENVTIFNPPWSEINAKGGLSGFNSFV